MVKAILCISVHCAPDTMLWIVEFSQMKMPRLTKDKYQRKRQSWVMVKRYILLNQGIRDEPFRQDIRLDQACLPH